jgi:uncharacterized protein (DUF1800 family)
MHCTYNLKQVTSNLTELQLNPISRGHAMTEPTTSMTDVQPIHPLTLLPLSLAACGGSADDAVDLAGDAVSARHDLNANDLQGSPATNGNTRTEEEAAAFLARAAFGATPKSIARVRWLGFKNWIRWQEGLRSDKHTTWLTENGFGTKEWLLGKAPYERTMWRKYFTAEDELRQRLVYAWSQIFVVSGDGISVYFAHYSLANYLDVLEEYVLGNFKDLLKNVTLTTAMGCFLNMRGNRYNPKAVPDENFAREIMQLFTIGLTHLNEDGTSNENMKVPTYTNEDVKALAAILTGWDFANADSTIGLHSEARRHLMPMVFDLKRHVPGGKTFFNQSIPEGEAGLDAVLDILCNHANTGPFIARRLIQLLVTSNPSRRYVKDVARVFANNGKKVRGDLLAVTRAVLLHQEATQENPDRAKLREPVLRLLQWGRTFGARSISGKWTLETTGWNSRLGQMPLRAPSVFGFFSPDYHPPGESIRAPEFQLLDEATVVSYIKYMLSIFKNEHDVQANYESEIEMVRNLTNIELVQRYNLLLTANTLSSSTVNEVVAAISGMKFKTNIGHTRRIGAAAFLIMCCSEYLIQT